MKLVVMLPGQGSQRVGMGKDLYETFPAARDAYQSVDDTLGVALGTLAFEGPVDELTRTHNAQPALLTHSAAVWAVVQDVCRPHVVAAAGHSLGEFSAYHIAGTFSLTDAAHVVRKRGSLMYEQGLARPGAMAAIIGVLNTPIDAICTQATAESGLVVPANYNSAEQVVISGEVAGVDRAMVLAKEAGAKRCLALPVSGAFHSPLMAAAASGLDEALAAATMHMPRISVVANVNAEPILDAAKARERLVQQLTAPVQWIAVMQRLAIDHPDALFVEMGSGSVLTGLARRIVPNVKTTTCGTVAEVETLLQLVTSND